jgi:hypothetical protein
VSIDWSGLCDDAQTDHRSVLDGTTFRDVKAVDGTTCSDVVRLSLATANRRVREPTVAFEKRSFSNAKVVPTWQNEKCEKRARVITREST